MKMADACRSAISAWWDLDKDGDNAGLMRDRFLRVAVKDKKNHPQARKELFEAMRQSLAQSKETYEAAYQRQESTLMNLKSKGFYRTDGRMIIGLGGENVLETGLTLNHTYGTPLIPGSALKGLAAHYCDQAWGAVDDKFKLSGEYHKVIFGTTEDSGHIIFHDAWITPDSLEGSLQLDVMTPHHGDYYSDETGSTAPTDFDDPNPVTFLSIVGTFKVAVSCDVSGPIGDEWACRVFELLSDALQEWGIGGKTNAGYGRLIPVGSDQTGRRSIEAKDSAAESSIQDKPHPQNRPQPIRMMRYKKGDTIEVTKVTDPKEKRNASYFMADDGFGGLVVLGTPPSVEIGQKIKLEINGVMEKEGIYNFATIGAKKETGRKSRDGRGRR
jgi:CRISPR-associated protein Cmr6